MVTTKHKSSVPGTPPAAPVNHSSCVALAGRSLIFCPPKRSEVPHQGSALSGGILCGLTLSDEPGKYQFSRAGEMLRCPWHNWEFDIRTGKSWFDPRRTKVRAFPAHVEAGAALASDPRRAQARSGESAAQKDSAPPSMPMDGGAVEGPYQAETFPVKVEADYVVVEV
jgi:nitrite reductase/ring-hydroxylating ferredoxin subunit